MNNTNEGSDYPRYFKCHFYFQCVDKTRTISYMQDGNVLNKVDPNSIESITASAPYTEMPVEEFLKRVPNPIVVPQPKTELLYKTKLIERHLDVPGLQVGWGNGYVGVSQGYPWYEKHYDDINCSVHGGLTFSEHYVPAEVDGQPQADKELFNKLSPQPAAVETLDFSEMPTDYYDNN